MPDDALRSPWLPVNAAAPASANPFDATSAAAAAQPESSPPQNAQPESTPQDHTPSPPQTPSAAWGTASPAVLAHPEPPESSWDAVRELGQAAVVAASLGGPISPSTVASAKATLPGHAVGEIPHFDSEPAFVPQFETTAPPAPQAKTASSTTPSSPFAPVNAEERPIVPAEDPTPAAATPAFARVELPAQQEHPTQITATHVTAIEPSGTSDAPSGPSSARPRRLWLWVALGVLAAGGIGVVIYRLFFLPEPIILPAPVVTEAPATPTATPINVTDGSELLRSLPGEVWTYVLTSATSHEVRDNPDLPARTAEHLTLTYGASSGEEHFTVDVYQHFNEDDALVAFGHWSEGATDIVPLEAGGTVVGERALRSQGAQDVVVWRNGTLVLVLVGPAGESEQFFSFFGI